MHDVARASGVSQKTVSRALNDEPGVNAETRRRVLEAVERLAYRRNDSARQLRPGQRTLTVGLVVGDVGNPWYSRLTSAVERYLNSRGYLLITCSTSDDGDLERRLVRQLCERRVDGLLIVPSGTDHGYLDAEIRAGTPIVFLDRPAQGLDADSVVPEHRDGTKGAVEYLIGRGHTRIAYVGPSLEVGFPAEERLAGYQAALAAHTIPIDDTLISLGPLTTEAAAQAVKSLTDLADPPTAILTSNNRATIGALQVLGLDLNGVALIGYDDFELADLLPVPITVVAHDPAAMGIQGIDILLGRLAGDESPPRHTSLDTVLIHRASGNIRPRRRMRR